MALSSNTSGLILLVTHLSPVLITTAIEGSKPPGFKTEEILIIYLLILILNELLEASLSQVLL